MDRSTVGDRAPEFEEIIGHHLEQAYRYRSELGWVDQDARALAVRAAERLASSGRRAFARGDLPAATSLFPRALDLLPDDHPGRALVLADLGQTLLDSGDLARAEKILDIAGQAAKSSGDRRAAARARLSRLWHLLHTSPEGQTAAIQRGVEELVPILETEGDERGAVQAIDLLVEVDWMACRYAAVEEALERVAARARRIGDRRLEMGALHRLAMAVWFGPTPVEAAIRRCRDISVRASGDRRVEASVLIADAGLRAMLGRFDGTREQIVEAREMLQDLGLRILSLAPLMSLGQLELLAGDPDAAERNFRQAYEGLERLGERGFLSTIAALLANAIYEQGRYEEAERYARISEEAGGSDDVASVVISRSILGRVLARRDRVEEGEALTRGAVELAEGTDDLVMCGDTYVDLAEILSLSNRAAEAAVALEQAVTLYERKGNVVSAERARERLAALAAAAGPP